MTNEELLQYGSPTLKKIDKAIAECKLLDILRLFDSPQPKQWIEEEQNALVGKKYFFNRIGLIEALLDRVFTDVSFAIVSQNIIQEKGKLSAVCHCRLHFKIECDTSVYRGNSAPSVLIEGTKDGVAATYAESIKHLTLAVPLAYSNAKKSAARQLGDFFGKSLNRYLDDIEEIPVIKTDYGDSEDDPIEKFKSAIRKAATYEQAMNLINAAGVFKNTLLYSPEIKEFLENKKNES